MLGSLLRKRKVVGLDVGSGSVKALALEGRGADLVVTGLGSAPVAAETQAQQVHQAIHLALADAGADSAPVVAAVGGSDVVIRQVSLPPLPPKRIIPALEMQYRELGLHPPDESVLDAQILRSTQDDGTNEILSVSVPRALVNERTALLRRASVNVQILDVEPLAILNGALHLTGLEAGELLVVVNIGRESSVLCLFSEQGPVVARYLEVGAEVFTEQIRVAFQLSPFSTESFTRTISPGELPKAEAACREVIERMAEDIRLSLTFYRTEYDRESLPRYALGGWADIPYIGRWLGDRLGLSAPFEVMDPLQAVDVRAPQIGDTPRLPGPQFLQAFGLALRGI
ncbi:MAG TPA: pilus assembly protein PilM [Candidatus Bathyarchaeia archaeon]|nr:pilus assembly protein PilM [Candidatus Bathyarchaeia archaeon]